MTNFCTLFDSNYLSRGLLLYKSLLNNTSKFHLYILAFDDGSYNYLRLANLNNATVISLQEFEDEELLNIKESRSKAEYCWTSTPSLILYCLKSFNLDACTYIDADMIFYKDPVVLIDEMGDKSILLSEHNYTSEYDQSKISGRFCVQFMTFKNSPEGRLALEWWRNKCIEWCYARAEDGKFGDQKYLDDWELRFSSVHVLQNKGGGVAPWNIQQFDISESGKELIERNTGNVLPLIFYHFHGVKIYSENKFSCTDVGYELNNKIKEKLYYPYFIELSRLEKLIKLHGLNYRNNNQVSPKTRFNLFLDYIVYRLSLMKVGNINFYNLKLTAFNMHYHIIELTSVEEFKMDKDIFY
jgi:hypothetical protein